MAGWPFGDSAPVVRRLLRVHRPPRVALPYVHDLTSWRIYTSDDLQFADGGVRVLTSKTHHYGPVGITTVRTWDLKEAHPEIGLTE